jgi:hypothetical protein
VNLQVAQQLREGSTLGAQGINAQSSLSRCATVLTVIAAEGLDTEGCGDLIKTASTCLALQSSIFGMHVGTHRRRMPAREVIEPFLQPCLFVFLASKFKTSGKIDFLPSLSPKVRS